MPGATQPELHRGLVEGNDGWRGGLRDAVMQAPAGLLRCTRRFGWGAEAYCSEHVALAHADRPARQTLLLGTSKD